MQALRYCRGGSFLILARVIRGATHYIILSLSLESRNPTPKWVITIWVGMAVCIKLIYIRSHAVYYSRAFFSTHALPGKYRKRGMCHT